nr:hypothetical protein GCM10020093_023940 [Planobispora longispora]
MIAALTSAAQEVQSRDRTFSLELIRWARPPGGTRRDGVPAEGYPREPGRTTPHFAQRDYAQGRPWGNDDDQSMSTSTGVVALLTTRGDSREDWIAAGQALQRVLLHASAHGVGAAFHTQSLEMFHLREFLRQELCSDEYPQMITRLGFSFDEGASTRRPVGKCSRSADGSGSGVIPRSRAPRRGRGRGPRRCRGAACPGPRP